jgi:hypothetical protein
MEISENKHACMGMTNRQVGHNKIHIIGRMVGGGYNCLRIYTMPSDHVDSV